MNINPLADPVTRAHAALDAMTGTDDPDALMAASDAYHAAVDDMIETEPASPTELAQRAAIALRYDALTAPDGEPENALAADVLARIAAGHPQAD